VADDLLAATGGDGDPLLQAALFVIALLKLIETGMPTPTVEPSSGVKLPMKLLAGETVVNDAFSWAARPSESLASAVTLYVVARSSWPEGFQLFLSADIWPATAVPDAVCMVTDVSVPLLTVTAAALLMEALSEPSLGVILICASEVFLAAASSTLACDVPSPPSDALALPPPPLHAESTSTPPSSADAVIRRLRRLLSVITRFSIVAESPKDTRAP